MKTYYAHVSEDRRTQTVSDHLRGTAERARNFAMDFDPSLHAEEQAYTMGWMHDIGKFSDSFQKRILYNGPIVDHSTAGAKETNAYAPEISFAIAGHHSGLPDYGSQTDSEQEATLSGRLKRTLEDYSAWKNEVPVKLKPCSKASYFQSNTNTLDIASFSYSFYIRMLYSCLVDADYLDTESFMPGNDVKRGGYASIKELEKRLEQYVSGWWNPKNELNKIRSGILRQCFDRGKTGSRGLYTLTVPTGGGKTVSSLAFALKMAEKLKMKRVIYVIPYTSIIDQNAKVFSEILGEENVVEHHSGVIAEMDESSDSLRYRKALATENWDAPVIVTTAVQFFESLYAFRSSKCRKLHNLANSVIIFDEAQTIPVSLLRPCMAAVAQLVRFYQTTAVLCTATQPSLKTFFDSDEGLHLSMKEIVDQEKGLSQKLRRTTIREYGAVSSLDALSEKLSEHDQFLCIVNKRETAQELFARIGAQDEGCYCLTTLIYPKQRKKKIEEIRTLLSEGKRCKVISTSLIEAGVDLDFPVVFREKAGLDSIIQAGGRCNREGKRPAEDSLVWIFDLPDGVPKGIRQNTAATDIALKDGDYPDDKETIKKYFDALYWMKGAEGLDTLDIMNSVERGMHNIMFPFREVGNTFHLIDNDTTSVYIFENDDEEGIAIRDELRSGHYSRALFRRAGQYSVNIYHQHFQQLKHAGKIEICDEDIFLLSDLSQYDPNIGLKLNVQSGEAVFV